MSAKHLTKRPAIILSLLLAAAALSACRARYHTVHKGLGVQENGAPGTDDALPGPAAPTAGVEVVKGGAATTKVTVDDDFIIRPTEGTRDPDNGDVVGCRNPGIIKAAYVISDGSAPVAARANASNCTTLEVPHKIATPGTYTVTLTVTSDENETATATLTLVVAPKDNGLPNQPTVDGGFVVTATPTVAYPGDPISFGGDCDSALKISWIFGDGVAGSGAATTHAYSATGQYTVAAECERQGGTKLSSSVSITIIPRPGTDGGDGAGNDGASSDGDGTNDGGDGTNGGGDGKDGSGDGKDGSGDGKDGSGDGKDGSGDGKDGSDDGKDGSDDGSDGDGNDDNDGGDDGKPENPGDDGDDDPTDGGTPGQHPGQYPGQNPSQNPGQSPHQSPNQN